MSESNIKQFFSKKYKHTNESIEYGTNILNTSNFCVARVGEN